MIADMNMRIVTVWNYTFHRDETPLDVNVDENEETWKKNAAAVVKESLKIRERVAALRGKFSRWLVYFRGSVSQLPGAALARHL